MVGGGRGRRVSAAVVLLLVTLWSAIVFVSLFTWRRVRSKFEVRVLLQSRKHDGTHRVNRGVHIYYIRARIYVKGKVSGKITKSREVEAKMKIIRL